MLCGKVLYILVFKHLLSYVIGYNNPVVFTDNANNELEKCNRNSGMDIWYYQQPKKRNGSGNFAVRRKKIK